MTNCWRCSCIWLFWVPFNRAAAFDVSSNCMAFCRRTTPSQPTDPLPFTLCEAPPSAAEWSSASSVSHTRCFSRLPPSLPPSSLPSSLLPSLLPPSLHHEETVKPSRTLTRKACTHIYIYRPCIEDIQTFVMSSRELETFRSSDSHLQSNVIFFICNSSVFLYWI